VKSLQSTVIIGVYTVCVYKSVWLDLIKTAIASSFMDRRESHKSASARRGQRLVTLKKYDSLIYIYRIIYTPMINPQFRSLPTKLGCFRVGQSLFCCEWNGTGFCELRFESCSL
jgi:hypothetical protein